MSNEDSTTPITVGSLRRELTDQLFGVERGLLHTFLRIWREPTVVAERYVARDRAVVSPVRYMLLAIAGYTGLAWLFLHRLGLAERLAMTQKQSAQTDFVLQHAGWVVLLVVPIVAFVLWLPRAARERSYTLALVLVTYTQAQVLWLQALVGLPLAYLRTPWPALVVSLAIAVYMAWAWRGFHGARAWRGWIAAVLGLVVGTVANQLLVLAALRLHAMG